MGGDVLGLLVLGKDVVGDDGSVGRNGVVVQGRSRPSRSGRQVRAQRRNAILPTRRILRADNLLQRMNDVKNIVHPPHSLIVRPLRSIQLARTVSVELGEFGPKGGGGAAVCGAEFLEGGGEGGGVCGG